MTDCLVVVSSLLCCTGEFGTVLHLQDWHWIWEHFDSSLRWVETIAVDIGGGSLFGLLCGLEWEFGWVECLEFILEHSNFFGGWSSDVLSLLCGHFFHLVLCTVENNLCLSVLPGEEVSYLGSKLCWIIKLCNICWAFNMEPED